VDEYTPTTEQVREAYQMTGDGLDFKRAAEQRGGAFDRWLADHDKAVRQVTLQDAADAAMGPSVSGILHDGATARDIAGAIRVLAEGDTSA
jgi:hypothetical protein